MRVGSPAFGAFAPVQVRVAIAAVIPLPLPAWRFQADVLRGRAGRGRRYLRCPVISA